MLGDDKVDDWKKYLDLMVDSVLVNSGRGCINCSGVWASRHTKDRRSAGRADGASPTVAAGRSQIALAAFTVPGQADAVSASIDADLKESGTKDMTGKYGPRLVKRERYDYLRPTVMLCDSPERSTAKKEFMFPF